MSDVTDVLNTARFDQGYGWIPLALIPSTDGDDYAFEVSLDPSGFGVGAWIDFEDAAVWGIEFE